MHGAVMQREQGAQRRCALALFIEVSPRAATPTERSP